MFKWILKLFRPQNRIEFINTPEEWIVTSLGQSIKDGTWFCEMLWAAKYLDTNQDCIVFTEEHPTAKAALQHAIVMIHNANYVSYSQQIQLKKQGIN
jgi:hypothetical protein